MTANDKKSLQNILHWVESFTGVGVSAEDLKNGFVCRSSWFKNESGKAFDPDVVKAFENSAEKFKEARNLYGN